jgi:uncharacterized protein
MSGEDNTMSLERKTISLTRAKALTDADKPGTFEGFAAAYGNVDRDGEIIERGAFANSLPKFLREGVIAWQHDWAIPIGKPLEAREEDAGLYLKAVLSQTACGKDALMLLRDGVIQKMSIGYRVKGSAKLSEEQARQRLGDAGYEAAMREMPPWMEGVIRVLADIDLFEVSLVTVPANPAAVITGVKAIDAAKSITTVREFEEFLRDVVGFPNAAAVTIASKGFAALQRDSARADEGQTDEGELAEKRLAAARQYAALEARLSGVSL